MKLIDKLKEAQKQGIDIILCTTARDSWVERFLNLKPEFRCVFDKKYNGECCEMLLQDNVLFPLVKNIFNLTNDKQALDKLNSDDNLRKTLSTLKKIVQKN